MNNTFKRVEKKYLITKKQHDLLLEKIRDKVRDDYYSINGSYKVYNIYFDSNTNKIVHLSNLKPYFKEKIRIRTYDISTSNICCFFEVKRKIGKEISKRRINCGIENIMNYAVNKSTLTLSSYKDNQIYKELDKTIEFYDSHPKVYLSYSREAYYDINSDDLRITFDNDIIFRYDDIDFKNGDYGTSLLKDDQYIMEIKFKYAIPLWLSKYLSELKIYPQSFSKYGEIYKLKLKENYYNV